MAPLRTYQQEDHEWLPGPGTLSPEIPETAQGQVPFTRSDQLGRPLPVINFAETEYDQLPYRNGRRTSSSGVLLRQQQPPYPRDPSILEDDTYSYGYDHEFLDGGNGGNMSFELGAPSSEHSVNYGCGDDHRLLSAQASSPTHQSVSTLVDPESLSPKIKVNVLGMPVEGGDEYADDEQYDIQLPIVGDEYALNTWQEIPERDDASTMSSVNPSSAKVVRLYKGNLVLDCPVSLNLLKQFPTHQPAREFTHMRYSAATCDPKYFGADNFTLRPMCYARPRETELFIAITIYNEDDLLLGRTLQGVFNNIRHLCHRTRSKTWGADAWKKVVVCVIADGREKINPRAQALMSALGVFQAGFAKNIVNDKPVEAHIYEYTTMVRIAKVTDTVKLTTEKATPVQLMFCLKEKNKKKINSHRWFFEAFAPILKPNVCVLLDAGTRPGNHAIYHLWKTFERDPLVAGACGEIAAMLGTGGNKLLNPLVAAQNFEYKMSNILDKPMESVFGFISVLPGAFSAYRYVALLNDEKGRGPLEKYFKGETLEATGGIFSANMYLAEDRILCWELVAKRSCGWILKYVKSAKAHTDVPERLGELILQRRRWLNGSFFASIYAQVHMFSIWRTAHPVWRKLLFHVEFLYQTFSLLFSWFSIGNFFLVFYILAEAVGRPSLGFAPGHILSIVLDWVYFACLITTFVLAFGNRPKGTRILYALIVLFFAVLMGYVFFCNIYVAIRSVKYAICKNGGFEARYIVTDKIFRDLLISVMATIAMYLVSSIMFLDPWHMITSFLQYSLLSASYINVLNVYAFCNTHDISWGTKGDTSVRRDLGVARLGAAQDNVEVDLPTDTEVIEQQYLNELQSIARPPEKIKEPPNEAEKRIDYYAAFRSSVVLVWLFMNIALVAVILNVSGFMTMMKGSVPKPANSAIFRRDACQPVDTGGTEVTRVYLAVILWSVAGMSAYRFVFAIIYLVQWFFRI